MILQRRMFIGGRLMVSEIVSEITIQIQNLIFSVYAGMADTVQHPGLLTAYLLSHFQLTLCFNSSKCTQSGTYKSLLPQTKSICFMSQSYNNSHFHQHLLVQENSLLLIVISVNYYLLVIIQFPCLHILARPL